MSALSYCSISYSIDKVYFIEHVLNEDFYFFSKLLLTVKKPCKKCTKGQMCHDRNTYVNPHVHCGLWVIRMCQSGSSDCDKCTTLVGILAMKEGRHVWRT